MRILHKIPRCFLLSLIALGAGIVSSLQAGELPPPVERELRGLWIATVDNVDWPSSRNLPVRQQKEELLAIMDRAVELNINTLILQVRPSADALYDSKLEPWSEYLTGQMGRAPSVYYDPLAFAVEEAHKRGLELHAWFNPYRARFRDTKTPAARNHVTVKHPELVRSYGNLLWMDPSEPGTRDHALSVIMDVVRRYDIDGVHFDDYFYPYPEKKNGKPLEFPDEGPWLRYQKQGGKMSRADWRRDNVEMFIRDVYAGIKRDKPWVKFGISPFGIWQPGHPLGILGFNSYDKLFADSRKWLERGWVDYLAPQLYWPVDPKPQSFPVLLKWWASQNSLHRILCPGMKMGDWRGITDNAVEMTREIDTTRQEPGVAGELLWHARALMQDQGKVAEALAKEYLTPALTPACPWLDKALPERPILAGQETRREIKLHWKPGLGEVWRWVVQKKTGDHWTTEILPGAQNEEVLLAGARTALPTTVAVSAVNRYGNQGPPAFYGIIP